MGNLHFELPDDLDNGRQRVVYGTLICMMDMIF